MCFDAGSENAVQNAECARRRFRRARATESDRGIARLFDHAGRMGSRYEHEFYAPERVLEAGGIELGSLGSAAFMAGLPESAMAFGGGAARIVEDPAVPVQAEEAPKYHIKFAVCGMSHDHIYGMIGAVQRGGGELVAAWGGEDDKVAAFRKRFPDVKIAKTQDEILDDPAVQLVLTSQIASERAGIAVRAMKHGKDFSQRQAGNDDARATGRCAQDHRRDQADLRNSVQRTAGGEGGCVRGGSGAAGRDRQGDSDHQYCAASDFSARGRRWRQQRPA